MEILDIVNDDNEIVGSASYDEIYSKRLNHRIVHVLVFNSNGEVFLQRLSASKKFCPGHWGTSAGGHVKSGESYEQAAERELKEELGVSLKLDQIHESAYDHYKMRKFLQVFRAVSEGPFILDQNESSEGKWFSINDLRDMVKKHELIHPELAHIIEKLY